MKEITCINAKSYNLTVGNTYETLNNTDNSDVYTIINDRGLTRNYAASLFEDVVSTLTDDEIINSIALGDDGIVTLMDRNGNDVSIATNNLMATQTTTISCGIRQITGINNISSIRLRIDEFFNSEPADFRDRLTKIIFKTKLISVLYVCDDASAGLVILSTNTNDHYYDLSSEVLDELAASTIDVNNPNSGNDIRMWTIDLTSMFED